MTRNFVRTIARLSAGSALACVLALSAAAADKAPASDSGPKLSKAVGPTMIAAQKAANAGDWQGALTQARAAQAIADRTPYDDVEINDFIGVAAVNMKDYKTATAAFEAAAIPANSDMPAGDREQLYHNALLLSADAQQWQKAIAYGQVLEGMNKMDDALYADMAVGYYNLKDTAHATQYAQKSIAAAKAAGKQPDQNVLKIVMSGEVVSNPAAAEEQLANIIMQSNSPEDWGRLIDHNFGRRGHERGDGDGSLPPEAADALDGKRKMRASPPNWPTSSTITAMPSASCTRRNPGRKGPRRRQQRRRERTGFADGRNRGRETRLRPGCDARRRGPLRLRPVRGSRRTGARGDGKGHRRRANAARIAILRKRHAAGRHVAGRPGQFADAAGDLQRDHQRQLRPM